MAQTKGWWVHSKPRTNNNRSRVGPFPSATAAGVWADENRPTEQWTVTITYLGGNRR